MKTAKDPRHKKREQLVKKLYEYSFGKGGRLNKDIKPIINYLDKIDKLIVICAPEWPIDKLNKIDLAILRLALYELMAEKKNPHKVIIDEAVELAKQYGSESSSKFVNGVLGTALKEINAGK
jgi:transcription antitermination protein NusB